MSLWLILTAYNILWLCCILFLGLPFWVLGQFKPKYHAGLWQKLGFFPSPLKQAFASKNKKRIVLHAVSVGELMAARPLIDWIIEWHPEWEIVLSNVTKTGHELAEKLYPQLHSVYLCFDFLPILLRWFKVIRPDLILVMETELWPSWTFLAHAKKIPIAIISGRLSKKSFKNYSKIAGLIRPFLRLYTGVYAQSELDLQRYLKLGALAKNASVLGNLKFCPPINATLESSADLMTWLEDWAFAKDPILVFASTHFPEESQLMGLYQQLRYTFKTLRCVVAVRHPERFDSVYEHITQDMGLKAVRRSQLEGHTPSAENILLLDSIGELNLVYRYSTLVVMGGSYNPKVGGHNILEPLYAGIPVIFGPHMHNFTAVKQEVLDLEAGLEAKDLDQTRQWITTLLQNSEQYQHYQQKALGVFTKHQDILKHYVEKIQTSLPASLE